MIKNYYKKTKLYSEDTPHLFSFNFMLTGLWF